MNGSEDIQDEKGNHRKGFIEQYGGMKLLLDLLWLLTLDILLLFTD